MPAPYDCYLLCSTPRSGSTLLCDLLAATAGAGTPDSFFMADVDPVWAAEWGLPPETDRGTPSHARAMLAAARTAGRGAGGICGIRLMQDSLARLMALIDLAHPGQACDLDRLQAAFGRVLCIHLTRPDKLAQAISLVKAEQTGLWHAAPDGTEVERLAPPQPPAYDFARIKARLDGLERAEAAWRAWFRDQRITPLTIDYDALSARPAAAVHRICAALGLPAPPDGLRPGLARLADAVSRDWHARFRAETRAEHGA